MLVALVLATSCIKEDYDDCDNVTIYFQYLADGNTDVLYRYMSKVDLYVFDEGGHILGVGHYTQDELSSFSAKPSFKLPAGGRYKVVAVGNAYDDTEVVNLNATSFDDIFIQHPSWGSGDIVTGHDHNYMGQKEFIVPGGEGVMYRDTVTLYSSHVNVSVEIHGLPAPTRANEGIYQLSFENSNAQTSFENEVNPEAQGTCCPPLVYDEATGLLKTQDLALFRMDGDGCCNHLMKLMNAEGKVVAEKDIDEYIEENKIDITKAEVTLRIGIEFTQLGPVEIHIPDWEIVDVTPEL